MGVEVEEGKVQQVEFACFASSFRKWQCQAYLPLIITSHQASRDWLETRELHAWQRSADEEIKIGDMPGACSSWLCCVGRCARWHSPPVDKAVKQLQATAPMLQGQKKVSEEPDDSAKESEPLLYLNALSVFEKREISEVVTVWFID